MPLEVEEGGEEAPGAGPHRAGLAAHLEGEEEVVVAEQAEHLGSEVGKCSGRITVLASCSGTCGRLHQNITGNTISFE